MKTKKEDEWATLLSETIRKREKRPDGLGWYTAPELANKLGIGINSMKKNLRQISSSGGCEKFVGTELMDGKICNQTWYRIKKGKK